MSPPSLAKSEFNHENILNHAQKSLDRAISILNRVASLMGVMVGLLALIFVIFGAWGFTEIRHWKELRGKLEKDRNEAKKSAEEAIMALKEILKTHPIPEILKIDNDSAFGANLPHERHIGKLAFFLLNLGIYPLYVAPRSPWNNGQVEGFNSVFSKKFWNKLQFSGEQEIDIKIKDFNVAYEKYSQLISNNPEINEENIKHMDDFKDVNLENKGVENFKAHKIYFLRIVRRKNDKGSDEEYGFIDILNHEIKMPKDLINLFVFCVLDLKSKLLKINIELDDGSLKDVKSTEFIIKSVIYD